MFLIECIVGILVVLYVVQFYQNKRKNDLIANLKGPPSIPLLGCLQVVYRITPENFLNNSVEISKQYGKLCRMWVLNRLVLVISDPKVAEILLGSQTNITKHHLYDLLQPWLGTGLLMSNGQKWHYRRKIITPTFHFKILEQFVEVFDQQSKILVKMLAHHSDTGKPFDVYPFICLSALDIIADLFQKSLENKKKYGKVYRMWVLNRLILNMSDPKVVEVLLSSQTHITKHNLYNLLQSWLGTGLLMSDGQKWHNRRKIITPTFHFKILEQFVEVFDQQSEILVKQLAKHCDTGKPFDMYSFICLSALDTIAETAMGTKINAQTDSTNEYTRAVTDITQIMFERFLKVHLVNETLFGIFCPKRKRRQTECIEIMHTFTGKVIKERRTMLQDTLARQTKEQTLIDDIGSKKRMALLDVLLQSTVDGKPLTDEDIREEVDTFMFEGHDTTTSAISFALTLIARHPEVQEKLFQEICSVLGTDQTESISYRVLQDLKYTECVIKETLRMYPPVPVIGRQLMHDLVYDGGVLPAGAEVLIGIWSMCNDADVFPEPNIFRPERHTLEVSGERASPFSFVPFSAGPRNCIGQKFAMLEIKSVITKILRYYELLPLGENVKPTINIVLRSSTGFQVGLKKRTY